MATEGKWKRVTVCSDGVIPEHLALAWRKPKAVAGNRSKRQRREKAACGGHSIEPAAGGHRSRYPRRRRSIRRDGQKGGNCSARGIDTAGSPPYGGDEIEPAVVLRAA